MRNREILVFVRDCFSPQSVVLYMESEGRLHENHVWSLWPYGGKMNMEAKGRMICICYRQWIRNIYEYSISWSEGMEYSYTIRIKRNEWMPTEEYTCHNCILDVNRIWKSSCRWWDLSKWGRSTQKVTIWSLYLYVMNLTILGIFQYAR